MFRTDILEQSYNVKTIVDIRHFWHGSKSVWDPIDSKDRYFLKIKESEVFQYKNVAIEKRSLKKDLVFSRKYKWDNVLFRILLPVTDLDTPIGEIHFNFNSSQWTTGYETELYYNKINHNQAIQYKIWFMRYLDAPQFVDLPEIIFRIPGYGQVKFTPYLNRFIRQQVATANVNKLNGLNWFAKTE